MAEYSVDRFLAVPEEMTFSVNETAKAYAEGRQAAIDGKPMNVEGEADYRLAYLQGWTEAAVNADGEDALPAALKFWNTEDEAVLEAVRDGLAEYGKTIIEFVDEAGIPVGEDDSFDKLVSAFEALEAEYEADGSEPG